MSALPTGPEHKAWVAPRTTWTTNERRRAYDAGKASVRARQLNNPFFADGENDPRYQEWERGRADAERDWRDSLGFRPSQDWPRPLGQEAEA